MRDTLLEHPELISRDEVTPLVELLFKEEIPRYIKENIDRYPELYCGLCYFFKKKE